MFLFFLSPGCSKNNNKLTLFCLPQGNNRVIIKITFIDKGYLT